MDVCQRCKTSLSRSKSHWTCKRCTAVYHGYCVKWQLSHEKQWFRCCTVWTVPDLKIKPCVDSKVTKTENGNPDNDNGTELHAGNTNLQKKDNVTQNTSTLKETSTKKDMGVISKDINHTNTENKKDIERTLVESNLANTEDNIALSLENCNNSNMQYHRERKSTYLAKNSSPKEDNKRDNRTLSLGTRNFGDMEDQNNTEIALLEEINSNLQKEYVNQNVQKNCSLQIKLRNEDNDQVINVSEVKLMLHQLREDLMADMQVVIAKVFKNFKALYIDIKGVIAPVFTPIEESGSINFSVIPEYIEYLHQNGVQGILVGGTTGESITLSLEERHSVLEAWLNVAKPLGMKVIMQVGGVPMPDVIKMAEYSEQLKADAIMTLPELYYKPKTTEQLVDYLLAISNAAPSLPLLYYHFPMMSGVDLNIPEFFKLASTKIPNFKGMKADLGVALQVSEQLGEDKRIFIGNHLLAPAVLLGHDSSIATVTNMFPKLVINIIDAVKDGKVNEARVLQEKLNALVTAIASQGEFLPAMKAAMPMVTGIKVGPPRRPNASLNEHKKNQLAENLSKLDYGRMD